MTTSSTPSTPRQLAPDPVADVVQLYLNVGEEGISPEEQEDVGLYNLYDSHTPQPCLKSPLPNLKHDSSSSESIDQEELAKKLQNHIDSATHSNEPSPKHNLRGLNDLIPRGPSPLVGGSETECGRITPTMLNEHSCLSKN